MYDEAGPPGMNAAEGQGKADGYGRPGENKYGNLQQSVSVFSPRPWVKEIRENGLWEEDVAILDWRKPSDAGQREIVPDTAFLLEHEGKRLGLRRRK